MDPPVRQRKVTPVMALGDIDDQNFYDLMAEMQRKQASHSPSHTPEAPVSPRGQPPPRAPRTISPPPRPRSPTTPIPRSPPPTPTAPLPPRPRLTPVKGSRTASSPPPTSPPITPPPKTASPPSIPTRHPRPSSRFSPSPFTASCDDSVATPPGLPPTSQKRRASSPQPYVPPQHQKQPQSPIPPPKPRKEKIFDCLLMVELETKGPGENVPHVVKYWPTDVEIDQTLFPQVVQFCFPDANDFPRSQLRVFFSSSSSSKEVFSFVLTETDGSRRFGFCQRVLLPSRFPRCFCVISSQPAFDVFSRVLDEVHRIMSRSSEYSLRAVGMFLDILYTEGELPQPGKTTAVDMVSYESGTMSSFSISRKDDDSSLDHVTFQTVVRLPSNILITIFASLLSERRMIFVAQTLPVLTSCINALLASLSPFTWQHVFIPVLPPSLISYCCAPMPFVVGILSSSLPDVLNIELETVMIVDVDAGSITVRLGSPEEEYVNDFERLPQRQREDLYTKIKSAKERKEEKESKYVLSQAFLYCIASLVSDIYDYMGNTTDGIHESFRRSDFLLDSPPEVQPFLETMVHCQFFERFVQTRMDELRQRQKNGEKLRDILTLRSSSHFDMMLSFYHAQVKSELFKKQAEENEKKRLQEIEMKNVSIGTPFNVRRDNHMGVDLRLASPGSALLCSMDLQVKIPTLVDLCIEKVLKYTNKFAQADILTLPISLQTKFASLKPSSWKASNKSFRRTSAATYTRKPASKTRSSTLSPDISIGGPFNMRHRAHVGNNLNEIKLRMLAASTEEQTAPVGKTQCGLVQNEECTFQ